MKKIIIIKIESTAKPVPSIVYEVVNTVHSATNVYKNTIITVVYSVNASVVEI